MKRYLFLNEKLDQQEFDFEKAKGLLRMFNDSDQTVSLVLSELKKAGWLEVKMNQDDTRKRIYKLKHYDDAFEKIMGAIKSEEARKNE